MQKSAYIIITSKCNYQCLYCFYCQDDFRIKEDKINVRNLREILEKLKLNNFNEITLTGGEPFLRKNLVISSTKIANHLGLRTNIDTNGSLLDKETALKLKSSGSCFLYLSIGAIFNIATCRAIKEIIPTNLIYVITKENLKNLEEAMKIAEKLAINLILQPAYVRKDYRYYNKLSVNDLDDKEWSYFKSLLEHWGKKNNRENYVETIISFYKNLKESCPKFCHMGRNDLVIDSDGSVYPCFHRQDLLAGNILEDSFDDILSKIKTFTKHTEKAPCFGEHCLSLFYN